MSIYRCKCGRIFEKNIGASTAPYRMPDYGPDHDCYGCPYVRMQAVFDPFSNQTSDVAECRGTRVLNPDAAQEITFEDENILKQIKEAKSMAKQKVAETPAEVQEGVAYIHGQWRYFVDRRTDNGKFTAFMCSTEPAANGARTEVTTIPDFDTFQQAQNALDGYALKRKFAAEFPIPDEVPEMEQHTFGSEPDENSNSVPPADDPQEVEQKNEAPESGDEADETLDSGDDSGDSANDAETSSNGEEKSAPLPDGPDLSLRLSAFNSVFDSADQSLRDLARAMKTKLIESGELSIKVVINNYGGVLKPDPKKCKVDCTPKPAKVSTQIRFPDDLEITVEQDGRVIVPEDRNQQLSFDDSPGGTVTVDGKTGIVEHYKEDDAEGQPEKPYPCTNIDCPFYGTADSGKPGCCYDPAIEDGGNPSFEDDVEDAVQFQGCTRPEIVQAYADAHSDDHDDQPQYSDGEDVEQEGDEE